MTVLRPALLLAVVVAGCADSHGLERDGGDAIDGGAADGGVIACGAVGPVCHDMRLGCCIRSTCVGSAWMCPLGTTPMASCPGSTCDVRSCRVPSQCVAVPESCCGDCGVATPTDVTAVNVEQATAYRGMACASSPGCDDCIRAPDPHLVATCEATGRCAAIDLGTAEWAGCTTDADCTLRAPECCACSAGPPIAIRADREPSLGTLLCDPDAGCPECEPSFDPLVARCEAGLCVVR